VEFALCFALLTPVVIGAVQFAVAGLQMQQLTWSVREAARRGSRMDPDAEEFQAKVRQIVLEGNPGLKQEQVGVEVRREAGVARQLTVWIAHHRIEVPGGAQAVNGRPRASYPFVGAAGAH
jgi:hypothetical protein